MSQTEEFSKGQPDDSSSRSAIWTDNQEASIEPHDFQNDPPAQTLYLVGSAFFLSGLAALTYEVVWQRVLVRVIGATTPAVATIICAFMVGLAIGGFVGAQLTKRKVNHLVVLTLLELLIGITALVSVAVCQNGCIALLLDILRATTGNGAPTLAVGFAMVFALIAIPTSLMGATLPVIAGFFARSTKRGVLLTRFYAINSAGAVFGAFMSGFFFLPMLGISGSLVFAAGLNLLASSLAFLASRSVQVSQLSVAFLQSGTLEGTLAAKSTDQAARASSRETFFNAGLALFTSTLSFTMQIVWTRFFVFLFSSSSQALSLVLAIHIAGLSIGAALVAKEKYPRKNSRIFASIALVLSLTSLTIASLLHQFQTTPEVFLHLKKLLLQIVNSGFWCDALAMILLAIPLILLPSLLIGMVFPLLLVAEGTAARMDRLPLTLRSLPNRTAIMYAGSLLGAVLASGYSIWLRPLISQSFVSGLEVTTIFVAVLYAIATLIVLTKQFGGQFITATSAELKAAVYGSLALIKLGPTKSRKERMSSFSYAINITSICLLIITLAGGLILIRPKWDAMLIAAGLSNVDTEEIKTIPVAKQIEVLRGVDANGNATEKLLMYREGLNSTVSVVERPSANLTYLRNNGKVEAAIPSNSMLPAPDSDLPTQKLLGLIPAVNSSGENIEGLVIGYGSGTTCSAILPAPWVKRLTAVELEEAIWQARPLFPSAIAKNEWEDSKLIPVITDARNYLSLRDQKFDFIVSQPPEPWLSGASDLFTVEFYQLIKKRLRGTGTFCQWVPLYSLTPAQLQCLVQTFQHVFPQTTIWHPRRAGEIILEGQLGQKADSAVIAQRLKSDAVSVQLQQIGIENRADFFANAIQMPASINQSLEDIVLNTDDNLLIEGKLAKDMNGSNQHLDEIFRRVFGNERDLQSKTVDSALAENALDIALALIKRNSQNASFATDDLFLHCISANNFKPLNTPPPSAIPPSLNGIPAIRFYLHTGNPLKAAELLKSTDYSSVKDYETLCDLATLKFLLGEYETALEIFQNAQEHKEAISARARAGIGLCLWMTGKSQDAIAALEESLTNNPNQFLPRYALAQSLLQNGQEAAALTNMRAAALTDPTSAWPGVFVTAYNIAKGDWQSANKNLSLALKRNPELPEAIALGYQIASKTGQTQQISSFANQYKRLTTRDITEWQPKGLIESILFSPKIVSRITSR